MSTITKEQLIEKLQHRIAVTANYPDVEEAQLDAVIFKIALASLEAEAVAYSLIFRNMDGVLNDYVNANTTFSTIEKAQAYGRGGNYVRQNDGSLQWVSDPSLDPVVVPLYTAPPAPVSVPAAMEMDDDFDSSFEHGKAVGWNAYRAAMLQSFGNSEQLNSPVIPDGWVACVERMPSAGEQVLAYRPDAPESNDPLIKMATYVGGSAHGHGFDCYCKPTHWMPLPAAPQQEA